MSKEERSYFPATEVRAAGTDAKPVIEGYAATYDTWSRDLGGFRESIRPGAFDRCMNEKQDVRCLFNHEPNQILGRTKAGTLVLAPDARGLFFRCILPLTTAGRDAYASIKRGDVSQCSFAFSVAKDGQVWGNDSQGPTRQLTDLNLFDVSPVVYPAYEDGTSVQARAKAKVFLRRFGFKVKPRYKFQTWESQIAEARRICHKNGIKFWTDDIGENEVMRTAEQIQRSRDLLHTILS